ncbi:MAG TPA: trypsin-like peptidase domain-containing protein [Saprospiraceae bacterium]|nr:trypsin-like peptidase domain-containing protein [Saprospiraceae bacterium]HMP14896.1 trypsin-like peptidase domain-containing protein [Saprospiraceae bacterium]
MKQIFSFIAASIFGGLIALGGATLIQQRTTHPTASVPAKEASFINQSPASTNVPFDFTAAAAKAMPAVVHIAASAKKKTAERTPDERINPLRFFFGEDLFGDSFNAPKEGTGSGVIYTTDGYIITNNHVVEFADELEVTLYDNRKFKAKLIGRDTRTDLAVIKIDANGLTTLKLADSDKAKVGEWVLAVGNPFNLTSTVTAGIISAKGRNINLLGGGSAIEAFIQTDAAVNPGNSGGALVDANGNLLGINTAIATRTGVFSGYSFAIPVNLTKRIVDDIIEFGDYRRPLLGINIYDLDSKGAAELGISITQGVVVDNVINGGSAQYAGIQPKDVIVKVDGRDVKSVPELQEIIGRSKVGDVVNVTVNRKGQNKDIPVKLKADNTTSNR